MDLRTGILKLINTISPLDLSGDANISGGKRYDVSCIINFYGRTELLKNILSSLNVQDLEKERFEILLVEDRGGTKEGSDIAEFYSGRLNIKYITLKDNFGIMGYSRNLGTEHAEGKYFLYLDDDTVILQKTFLSELIKLFSEKKPDGIMPYGQGSFCELDQMYQYHDPHYPTNRCMAYTSNVLKELGGFKSSIIGQEDVEFNIRLVLSGKKIIKAGNLEYFHPPLIQHNFRKSASVGLSYFNLRKSYPGLLWILLLLNGCRYLPYGLLFFLKEYKYKFKFSAGFLMGIIYGIRNKKVEYK